MLIPRNQNSGVLRYKNSGRIKKVIRDIKKEMMKVYRISKRQCRENIFLNELDIYLFANIAEVKNDKIIFTKQMQKMFITENLTRFSDITTNMQDLLKLQDITVILVDSVTKEEKIVNVEIEGGI